MGAKDLVSGDTMRLRDSILALVERSGGRGTMTRGASELVVHGERK
jgi:hypothetical protein